MRRLFADGPGYRIVRELYFETVLTSPRLVTVLSQCNTVSRRTLNDVNAATDCVAVLHGHDEYRTRRWRGPVLAGAAFLGCSRWQSGFRTRSSSNTPARDP